MNATKNNTIRGRVKQILNRGKIYSIQDYARKVSKYTGQDVSQTKILSVLRRMEKEGQLEYSIVRDRYVVGFTFKAA